MRTAGPYRLLRHLRRDDRGDVWLSRHEGQWCHVHIIDTGELDPVFLDESVAEFQLWSRVQHPNLLALHGAERLDDGQFFIATAHPHGRPLTAFMQGASKGGLSASLAATVVHQIAEAVSAIHTQHPDLGFVHRGVSPDNILVTASGRAVLKPARARTQRLARNNVMGQGSVRHFVLQHLSPEQVRGLTVDAATDVYGLGLTLYAALAGKMPFGGKNDFDTLQQIIQQNLTPLHELRPDLDLALCHIVARAMATNVEDRTPSAQAVADALEPFVFRPKPPGNTSQILEQLRQWLYEGKTELVRVLFEEHPKLLRTPEVTDYVWSHMEPGFIDALEAGRWPTLEDILLYPTLPRATPSLKALLADTTRSDTARGMAAFMLGSMDHPSVDEALIESLNEASWVSQIAFETLAHRPEAPPIGIAVGPVTIEPCKMSWDDLETIKDNPQHRHCGQCDRRVVRTDNLNDLMALAGKECIFYDSPGASLEAVEVRLGDWRWVLQEGDIIELSSLPEVMAAHPDIKHITLRHSAPGQLEIVRHMSWDQVVTLEVGSGSDVFMGGGLYAMAIPGVPHIQIRPPSPLTNKAKIL